MLTFQSSENVISVTLTGGVMVGVRQAGLSVSETADLLGFSWKTVSSIYSER